MNGRNPINVIVFLICTAMIAALLLPAMVRHRTAARQTACSENMKKLGLAIHNYHSAYKQMPMVCGGTTGGETDESCNQGRISTLVALLPFVENQKLWEAIVNPYTDPASGTSFPSMGPVPWYDAQVYRPWSKGPAVFRCPEASGPVEKPKEQKIVHTLRVEGGDNVALTTNYVACFGDGTHNVGERVDVTDRQSILRSRAAHRGMFVPGRAVKFRDVLDGLANTIMYSETIASVKAKADTRIAKNVAGLNDNPSLCLTAVKDADSEYWDFGRGSRWCDGALPITGFQTVLPPNSPSCTSENGMLDGVMSASSKHPGGAHALIADGSVMLIANTIDAGDSTVAGVHLDGRDMSSPGSRSPYGLWGALGTRASKEIIREQLDRVGANLQFPPGRPGEDSAGFTTWTGKSGEVTLSAVFVRVIDKKTIELEDAAGTLHQVPLNTLSDKDIFRAVSLDLESQQ